MGNIETEIVFRGFEMLLDETMNGPNRVNWLLNQGDIGFLRTLRRLTPEQGAHTPIPHRAPAAGHARHICYHLSLCNRANRGEQAFASADWAGSWKVGKLNAETWQALLDELEQESKEFKSFLQGQPELESTALTGVMATLVHVGYHLGALRQLVALL